MNPALHAQRILEAWNRLDADMFEAALENALFSCKNHVPLPGLDLEQQELLQAVVEHLRGDSATTAWSRDNVSAGLMLLRHLGTRPNRRPNLAHAASSA